jgi:HEAT repeat protein
LLEVGDGLTRTGFSDPNPKARRAAFEAMESFGTLSERFLPRILRGLDDEDPFVRWIAARVLSKLAPCAWKVAVPALVRRLRDDDSDVRIACTKALGAYKAVACNAVPEMGRQLRNGDVEFRLALMRALEEIGTASAPALPDLVGQLRNIDPRIRAEAARVIGRFGPRAQTYVPNLQQLSSDPDARVRTEASEAILNIVRD